MKMLYSAAVLTITLTLSSTASAEAPVGVRSYCPVTLMDSKAWEKGTSDHQLTYDSVQYSFVSAEAKSKFLSNPNRYVPALHGDCIVTFVNSKQRTKGSLSYATFYNGRMFLFQSEAEKKAFAAKPTNYANEDLAYDGACSICLIDAKINKPGSTTLMHHYKGLRYLFPNQILLDKFRRDPGRYEEPNSAGTRTVTTLKPSPQMVVSSDENMTPVTTEGATVSVTGKTACALCEFGVTPLGAPDELGLAITTPEGQVYILEDAHTDYPQVYLDRERGKNISITGTEVRRKGKITWVKLSKLQVLQ